MGGHGDLLLWQGGGFRSQNRTARAMDAREMSVPLALLIFLFGVLTSALVSRL